MEIILHVLAMVFFGSDTWYEIAWTALYIVGLWQLFRKSGIPSWWALIPFAREYMLAKCAGKEFEGRITSVTAFIMTVISLLVYVFPNNEYLILISVFLTLMLLIIHFIYELQVYSGLIEVYGVRKRWLWAWMLVEPLTALYWGFNKNMQPAWQVNEFRDTAVSHVTGKDVADVGEGLTVNLIDRSVTEFFQKRYLLKDIHMQIKPGRLVMLLGGSGAGKTTFVNAINGYEKANAKVKLNGRDVYAEYKKMMYEMGFVPQSDLMRGKDTVYYTLIDYANLRLPTSFTRKDHQDRVEDALKVFGLGPVRNQLVEKLSGGQRKRLSIAMEYLSNPSLFILDEPDSGVDGVMARELFNKLREVADTGRIVLAITHTPDRVVDLFDDVIILAKDSDRVGRLAYYGTVDGCREFFGKERMEEVIKTINRPEEGGDGRADEFIIKYAQEVQNV